MNFVSRNGLTLGPFLTLLVLATMGRRQEYFRDASHALTVALRTPPEPSHRPAANGPEAAALRHARASLGPFLTLILTLHCQGQDCTDESRFGPSARLLSVSAAHRSG